MNRRFKHANNCHMHNGPIASCWKDKGWPGWLCLNEKMCAKQIFLFNRKWVAWYWTRYKCCGCIQIVWDCMSHFSWRNELNSLQTSTCFYRYLSMVEVQEKKRNWEQGVESELLELPITLTWVWFIINAYPTCITPSWAPVAHKLLA